MGFYELSSLFLNITFFLYLIATAFFGLTLGKNRESNKKSKAIKIAMTFTIIGFASQMTSYIFRWLQAGHIPVSNMFEYIYFFSMMLILAFVVIYFIYGIPALGLIALPIAVVIIGYGSMFPQEISPLVPSLQSNWLYIHVTTVALAQAILSISFIAGLLFLIKRVDQSQSSKETTFLELILFGVVSTIAYIILSSSFGAMDYEATFTKELEEQTVDVTYSMPALFQPHDSELVTEGVFNSGIETPGWMQGADAGLKLNTLVLSLTLGGILYGLLRLILKGRRVSALLNQKFDKINPDIVDDIMYRAIAIGFPLFTLGGLIFASIWAQQAWGRFWGWDPKEVWALVTWLFYAVFLHLRLTRGWHGKKSAWLAVVGFVIIMFNLIVINLVISGLHSYA
ncbi:c-type cytochrome biogenesis protein CcsB [Alkalibacillus salilacus]|uniref:Cytochrome c-type biogenesis protein CcsB n=1 Tax=Alkalibacillus salilacus TaxID=284582 RepID=A0ABT9VC18_9BACI|nr:c-type cytochrome biogenesis protein CcsB [Alkalibacillus salilacus]MDQ0158517.1 cytochrome c-type biogenesis protein CcsB [Alkalibacillus salilacus]